MCEKGSYYADYDKDTQMWCVFHTNKQPGFAYGSFAYKDQAERCADHRNEFVKQSSNDGY